MDAQTLWEDGILIEKSKKAETDVNRILAYRLSLAREMAGVTQKDGMAV